MVLSIAILLFFFLPSESLLQSFSTSNATNHGAAGSCWPCCRGVACFCRHLGSAMPAIQVDTWALLLPPLFPSYPTEMKATREHPKDFSPTEGVNQGRERWYSPSRINFGAHFFQVLRPCKYFEKPLLFPFSFSFSSVPFWFAVGAAAMRRGFQG